MAGKATPLPPASLTPRRRRSPNGSNASAQKACMGCVTAPQDLFHRTAKLRKPHATPSRSCADSATLGSRSQPKLASRQQLSAASSNGVDSISSAPWSRPNRSGAMSARTQANSSISTSRSSAALARWDIASPDGKPAWSTVTMALAGSSSMSASTMPRASPSCRSWLISARKPLSPSFRLPLLITLGVRIARVMTDNGSCYRSKTFRAACFRLGLRQLFTRPYTPKTNGKAERFIQTALREWAYARAYQNSDQRSEELVAWLHRYNWHRPHGSLKANTPISRLALPEDNVLRLHS